MGRSRWRIGTACEKLMSTVRAACKAAVVAERHAPGPRHEEAQRHEVAQGVAAVVRDNPVPKPQDGRPHLPRVKVARRPPSSR